MKLVSKMLSFTLVRDGEQGKQGEPGPMPGNYGEWDKNIEYVKDSTVQPFVWVNFLGNRVFFMLVADRDKGTHPIEDNENGEGKIWRYSEKHQLILARKIQADEIDVSNLIAEKVQTQKSGPRVEIQGTEVKVFGEWEFPNIILGIDSRGNSVLKYLDGETGVVLYELNTKGLQWINIKEPSWERISMSHTGYSTTRRPVASDLMEYMKNGTISGYISGYVYDPGTHPGITEEEKNKKGLTFTSQNSNGTLVRDGWYCTDVQYPETTPAHNTGSYVKPGKPDDLYYSGKVAIEEGVKDEHPIYNRYFRCFIDGRIVDTFTLYWNGNAV